MPVIRGFPGKPILSEATLRLFTVALSDRLLIRVFFTERSWISFQVLSEWFSNKLYVMSTLDSMGGWHIKQAFLL